MVDVCIGQAAYSRVSWIYVIQCDGAHTGGFVSAMGAFVRVEGMLLGGATSDQNQPILMNLDIV